MGKFTLFVIFVLAISSFPDLSALASSCRSRQSATDPAVKMLQRQLSALRAIQRGRGCKPVNQVEDCSMPAARSE
ncbi:hypothetical protein HED63_22520 [Ochrobactrum cytisi]|nr:hypothetical protein [Brucella cytisi]